MHHHILLGVAVIGLGVFAYEEVLKPQVAQTADNAVPYVQSAVEGVKTLKSTANDAITAAKNSRLGQKIGDIVSDQTPFFDQMDSPPAKPAP